MFAQSLAYLGVRAQNLEDWRGYGTRQAGMQLIEKTRTSLAFRMDDHKQRVIVDADGGQGFNFLGWDVVDAATLDRLAARLEAAGVEVAQGSRALADERQVDGLIVTRDPIGTRLEFCHGARVTDDPFVPGRMISGFRTGPLGLGHIVMTVERVDEVLAFYRDVLGFGLSDYYYQPIKAFFLHVNPRHHSIAFVETGKTGAHHLMIEHFSLDDVGQGYDLAQQEEGRLAVTLGRHCGDYMTGYYTWTPSAFMIEHGWGGRLIDPGTWVPNERKEGPSLWGHERSWLAPEGRAAALKARLDNAARGVRRPVQVMEGNYQLMPGVCPWWDGLRGGGG